MSIWKTGNGMLSVVFLATACVTSGPSVLPETSQVNDGLVVAKADGVIDEDIGDEPEEDTTQEIVPSTTLQIPGSVRGPRTPQPANEIDGGVPDVKESVGEVSIDDLPIDLFSGEIMRLSDLKGKVVVLNFWASWCPPCRWEMPSFENVWLEYRDRGVVFVGIAEDLEIKTARDFAEKVNITYPLGLDPNGRFARDFQVVSLPTTFLFDREGNQAKKISNVANEGVLRVFLRGLLDDS